MTYNLGWREYIGTWKAIYPFKHLRVSVCMHGQGLPGLQPSYAAGSIEPLFSVFYKFLLLIHFKKRLKLF
jgi:hypothetical protein